MITADHDRLQNWYIIEISNFILSLMMIKKNELIWQSMINDIYNHFIAENDHPPQDQMRRILPNKSIFLQQKWYQVLPKTEISTIFWAWLPFEIYDRIYYDPQTLKIIP
jgi:hypothetical protein